jgi:hypothetical protein
MKNTLIMTGIVSFFSLSFGTCDELLFKFGN